MYKCTIYDTTRFKAVWGDKSGQYCIIGGGSLHPVSFRKQKINIIYTCGYMPKKRVKYVGLYIYIHSIFGKGGERVCCA
jgi:hypothetical protein